MGAWQNAKVAGAASVIIGGGQLDATLRPLLWPRHLTLGLASWTLILPAGDNGHHPCYPPSQASGTYSASAVGHDGANGRKEAENSRSEGSQSRSFCGSISLTSVSSGHCACQGSQPDGLSSAVFSTALLYLCCRPTIPGLTVAPQPQLEHKHNRHQSTARSDPLSGRLVPMCLG